MFKRLLSVGGFTLLSRITGFARDMLLAWILGAGILSDAFFVAFLFPNYFRAIFGEGTINPAFLPRYAALHAKGEQAAAAQFADRGFFLADGGADRAAGAGALVFMPWIMRVLAPGFVDNPGAVRADRAPGAHHLSLSDPDRGGGAAVRHAQRHRAILGRRGLVEFAQPGDDRAPCWPGTGFPTPPMPPPGACLRAAWRSWSSSSGPARAKGCGCV